jgi:hypothetical protein
MTSWAVERLRHLRVFECDCFGPGHLEDCELTDLGPAGVEDIEDAAEALDLDLGTTFDGKGATYGNFTINIDGKEFGGVGSLAVGVADDGDEDSPWSRETRKQAGFYREALAENKSLRDQLATHHNENPRLAEACKRAKQEVQDAKRELRDTQVRHGESLRELAKLRTRTTCAKSSSTSSA